MAGVNGKGPKRRPSFITQEQYAKNYEKIFGKKQNDKKTKRSVDGV